MNDTNKYLKMQSRYYEAKGGEWSLTNKDPVVGSYDKHNAYEPYDHWLFPTDDYSDKVALEYGCGPARNLIRFHDRFKQIDGVDIGVANIEKAKVNLDHNGISGNRLMVCDGKSIPCDDESYDVVFSVICLQHIAVFEIRDAIIKDIHRVLKPGGIFCFQMGYGGKPNGRPTAKYYDNVYTATRTNGGFDVSVDNDTVLNGHLEACGFGPNYMRVAEVGPGDDHANWVWAHAYK